MRLLKLVPDDTNIDFLRWRGVAITLSLLLMAASIALTPATATIAAPAAARGPGIDGNGVQCPWWKANAVLRGADPGPYPPTTYRRPATPAAIA